MLTWFCVFALRYVRGLKRIGAMTIGALLKKRRTEKDLTLEVVALEAGTDPGNLSRIERDAQQPSAALLKKIAQALGVTVTSLYAELESRNVKEPAGEYHRDSHQLQRKFLDLNPENQKLVLEFIKMLGRMQKGG